MDNAESLMQEHPKDALVLLDSLKQFPLKSKAENARFALLYSQALDKNHIDVTDDSLITIAENWYSKKGNAREKFLSFYYKGVVNKNAKNYPQAITAFSQAEKLQLKINDNYLLGLLYNQMGFIYNRHYEYKKSLDAFSKAYHLYELADMINHRNYMLLNIASCYWNMGDYDNSEEYYRKAIYEGERTNYRILVEFSAIDLIGQYVEQKRYKEAAQLYEIYKIEATRNRVKFTGNIARLQYVIGNGQEGAKLMKKAWEFAKNQADSISLYINEYYIYKHLGQLEISLESLAKADLLKTRSVAQKLQHPVLEVQKQLLEKDLELSMYKLESNRKIQLLIGILLTIIVLIVVHLLKRWLKKKEEKLAYCVSFIAELQDTMQHLQDILQLKNAKLNSAYADTAAIIYNRLNLINNLSVTLYEKKGTPKSKEIFIREVENIIDEFRTNDEDIKWMEQVINASNNNLLENIYVNYPALTAEEKKLLCYIFAGFSPKAISIFLNIPIETVYNRKSRLLAKIGLSRTKKQPD